MLTELHVQNIKGKLEKEGGKEGGKGREREMEGRMQELWFELNYES